MPNSMLDREKYGLGSIVGKGIEKLSKKISKVFTENDSEKEIKNRLNKVIDKIEGAPLGSSKKETFKEIAEQENVTLGFVKDADKINSYRSGGGKADSLLGEVASTVRAMVTKPTSGQADAEAFGGTPTTRSARRGKGFSILGTAVLTVPTTALTTAWFMRNDKEPTPKEASAFEKAFSKAHNAGKETFTFKGTEYTTDVRKGKAEGGITAKEHIGAAFLLLEDGEYTDREAVIQAAKQLSKATSKEELEDLKFDIKNRFARSNEKFPQETKFIPKDLKDKIDNFKIGDSTYKTFFKDREAKAEGGEMEDNSEVIRGLLTALKTAESPKAAERIQEQLSQFEGEEVADVLKSIRVESGESKEEVNRSVFAEGGSSMLVPPEMDMPVDTFTPEEQANAESSQLPDDEMEDGYMDYVLGESLDDGEQEYLMGALESDPRLSEIFDKVVTTASEFSGAGEVEGPGTGVSDSIPARLSDGEFVVTEEATSEIGADNLQTMMDDAERKANGGEVTRSPYQMGGLLGNPSQPLEEEDEDLVAQSMISANQMPSLMGGRR